MYELNRRVEKAEEGVCEFDSIPVAIIHCEEWR